MAKNAKKIKKEEVQKETSLGKETKKAILLIVIVLVIVVSLFVTMILSRENGKNLLKEYYSYYEVKESTDENNSYIESSSNNGINVLYLGRDGCGYCTLFEPVLKSVSEEYGVIYHYFDIDVWNMSQLTEVLEKANIDLNDFGTPTVILTKDGEAFAQHIGTMDRETLFAFFQENGVISADAILTVENPNLTNIDYTQYEELLIGNEKSIIVIGQTTCSHCIEAKPVLNEIAGEYGIDIYYLNYTDMTTEEREALQVSLPYFEENPSWGTPLNLIVQNGELVGVSSGFYNKQTLVDFFKTYGMINE